ncbi:type 2 lantipeptide synthetase LanM [Archangium violaceum]|uniref:type 2 lanthipeptide synthetase LanM n=1 Tax=Archangium violaceum TaxID=83451 RepID=UPI00194DFD41|nr:type 2 lanthipeptide synthetase LanM [Archangium violaceum]QRO00154.1 type 2 lantipeptide synthetase LanM [Archangium violaceum]
MSRHGEASRRALETLLRGAARASDPALAAWEGPPGQSAMAGLLAAADVELGRDLARARVRVLPSARRDLVLLLSRRLLRACLKVLALEWRSQEALGPGGGLDPEVNAWRERFSAYPVLAERMGGTFLRWRAHVRELLSRLSADREALGRAMWEGRAPGALAHVDGDAGDLHAGGRAVAVLRFEDGRRVVYKPKDLRVTRAVLDLYALLNDAGLPLGLHVHTVLCRRGHAWEEYVDAVPCGTAAGVERFYLRAGMLARLMQLLEAQDLWLDNLVAHGEHPVLVDLEMVLQPRLASLASGTARQAAEDFLSESVAPLGLLAAPFGLAPGVPAEDLGALTPVRAFLLPLPFEPVRDALEGRRRPCRDGYAVETHARHVPSFDGRPGRAAEHLEALREGYQAMHATLRANRARLEASTSPLRGLARLPVRYVHRDTWTYHRILEVLSEPRVLASAKLHEEELGSLLLAGEGRPRARALKAAAREELEALRALEIPYFTCHPGDDALLGPGGQPIRTRFFEGTAMERLRERLRALDTFPLARHDALLRSTLASGHHTAVPPTRPPLRPGRSIPDWLTEAISVGDVLLRESFAGEDGLAWLGLRHEPHYKLRQLDVLGPDLLSGTAGVAIALAELAAASRLPRFRDAALAALEPARATLGQDHEGPWTRAPDGTVEVGAFRGIGARLYALHRCAAALGLAELAREARARARTLPVERLAELASLDLVTGAPGLLLVLRACGATGPARRLARALEQRLQRGATPVSLHVPGLPDAASALALCGLRLPDAPLARGHTTGSETSGTPLSRIALGDGTARAAVLTGARRVLRRAEVGSTCLESLELALTAGRELREPALFQEALRLGQLLVAGHRLHGRWFPDRLEADEHDLSVLGGLCALLRALLGLHQPEAWTSLRLVRPAVETSGHEGPEAG